MDWEAPTFVEIRMDAEFTAYLDDLEAEDSGSASDTAPR
jgi:hypothetical protein